MAKQESKEITKTEPSRAISPFGDGERWIDELERWFEEDLRRPFSLMRSSFMPRLRAATLREMMPSVDIFEDGDDVVVKAEIPGMNKEEIDITVTDSTMTISGEKKQEEKVQRKDYYRMERSYGSFTRTFRLPTEVQSDKAKATYKEGVLEVRLPKSEEAKAKEKKISIQ